MENNNSKNTTFVYSILFFTFIPSLAMGLNIYNVVSLGANPDGITDSREAFVKAWDEACGSLGKSEILVPNGRYLIQNAIKFNGSKCKSLSIHFVVDGTLVAPIDFRVLRNGDSWLSFEYVSGVIISGGTLDGNGFGLWKCKWSGKGDCPNGVTTLAFTNSKNIEIRGLTSLNSQLGHISINGCNNVKIQGVRVLSSGKSPNTDGIHVQLSNDVTILNTKISTGDDCVSVGAGTTALWIQNVICGPGHGISIGSLAKEINEPGVQNVTVKEVTFVDTQNGVRIKSWGRPSNGFVNNVLFQHCTMVNAQNPIVIDQNYCPGNKGCPGKVSGVKISNIIYQDIKGSSATEVAMKFNCSPKFPCTNLILDDINLTFKNNQPAISSCGHAEGSTRGVVVPKSCF